MREQLSPDTDDFVNIGRCLSQESVASTCSTATETPERQVDEDRYSSIKQSSSDEYKSTCGSSNPNLADTESFSAESRVSSASNLSEQSSGLESSHSLTGHYPPSLQDFNTSVNADSNWTASSTSLLSDSMFTSTYSPKYEALENRVRKLCQSTSDLNEKMRLARLECSYIQTLS